MIYSFIAIIVVFFGITRGYRKGFIRQVPLLIGFCFGVICARIFAAPVEEGLHNILPSIARRPENAYIYSILARGLIYIVVYEIFSFCTGFLKLLFKVFNSGILDSIAGSFFALLRYMLMLSICYNFLICRDSGSQLINYAKSDDGNIVEGVLLIASDILGGYSVDDCTHILQLEEAKTIS